MITLYQTIRPLLFRLAPEKAHRLSLSIANQIAKRCSTTLPQHPCQVMGLNFPNPVGIAAGLDKNAQYLPVWGLLGAGFVEVGSVSMMPRDGNPLPRLFRLPSQQALINRIGLANDGIEAILPRLEARHYPGIVGVNIAKENHAESLDEILKGYWQVMQAIYQQADYITINLSCPHEPGLRALQFGSTLVELLDALKNMQAKLSSQHQRYVPLAIKLSPDLEPEDIAAISEQLLAYRIDGVIAGNTSNHRPLVADLPEANEQGGLSGKPLFVPSTELVRQLAQRLAGKIPIIAAGGIMTPDMAKQKLEAGASLLQVYTGLIYQGPSLIKAICRQL